MVISIRTVGEIIIQIRQEHPSLSPCTDKFKMLVAKRAELYELSANQVSELAIQIGLQWFPKPKTIPESWKLVICKKFLSQRYNNPADPYEYVIVVRSDSKGGKPYIIHRTAEGYADAQWFYEVFPQLEKLVKDPAIGRPFSASFNLNVNESSEMPRTVGQIAAINLFFEQYVPDVEGICHTCFKVLLPQKGSGVRFVHRTNEIYEVRLSAAKPSASFACQQVEYVTHREVQGDKTILYATWDKDKKVRGSSRNLKQAETHIPWDVYDFNKFKIGMPVCTCLKK